MRPLANERGFVKPVLIILILIMVVYTGYNFAIPYYKYSALKSDAKEAARISLGREDKLRKMINDAIEEHDVPVRLDDVHVNKIGNSVQVRISWEDEIDILGIYQKTLFFDIDVTE
jgi:hypothetical protein